MSLNRKLINDKYTINLGRPGLLRVYLIGNDDPLKYSFFIHIMNNKTKIFIVTPNHEISYTNTTNI